eukprot:scaffold7076_cov31-Prasinocladus_malaysianus.AAC.1
MGTHPGSHDCPWSPGSSRGGAFIKHCIHSETTVTQFSARETAQKMDAIRLIALNIKLRQYHDTQYD